MTLQELHDQIDSMVPKISDPEDRDRIEAYIERFWFDQVSLEETIKFIQEEVN